MMEMSNEETEMAYAGWRRCWKRWGGPRGADGHTHAAFIDIPFVRSFEEEGYEAKLSELIGRLHEKTSVPTKPSLSL